MTSFSTLTGAKSTAGSIADWVNHSSVPSTTILTEAQAWIYTRLRAREMRVSAEITISASASSASLPDRYVQPIGLKLYEDSVPLRFTDEDSLETMRSRTSAGVIASGRPTAWSVFDELLQFDVLASEEYKGRFIYYESKAALAASPNETNFLTDRYPALLRQVCLAFAYEYRKNTEQMRNYFALAEAAVFEANKEADLGNAGAYYDMGP